MDADVNELWGAYQAVRLQLVEIPTQWPQFAIITAYNPGSIRHSAGENRELDARLLAQIQALALPHCRGFCCGLDGDWREPGWAVACSLKAALKLATDYQQNAIYYISDGRLFLEPVLLSQVSRVDMGPCSQHLETGLRYLRRCAAAPS